MAAVYGAERGVVAALDAIFYHDIISFRKGGEIVQPLPIHTIGPSAYDETFNSWVGKSFSVFPLEDIHGSVGAGVGLEIGKVAAGAAVPSCMKMNTLVKLLGNALLGLAIVGVECGIVAERAAAITQRAVAVGTAKSCVEGQLLYWVAEVLPTIVGVIHAVKTIIWKKYCIFAS